MKHDPSDTEWQQHFPTYSFKNPDIAIEEFKIASRTLEAEERIFLTVSNISLAFSAALGSLLIGSKTQITKIFESVIPPHTSLLLPLLLIVLFSLVSLKYFSDRQRSIVFACRKVIILRRMLGLSYGHTQLLLPTWRVEGANEPLSIKMFPGWFSYAAYPFWMILMVSTTVILLLSVFFITEAQNLILQNYRLTFIILVSVTWSLSTMIAYRKFLLDIHESLRLIFFKLIANIFKIRTEENTELIIYRAKLACYEIKRNKIETTKIKKLLVFIEDRDFFKHSGVSIKAILRSLLSVIGLKPKSGGSTITQQLYRTLFVCEMHKTLRRKFLEIALAKWMNQIFTKNEILDMYIASVRYEKNCNGLIAAMNHFGVDMSSQISNAESFFLIERVSNIHSKLLAKKIIQVARAAKEEGLFDSSDLVELGKIYRKAVIDEKIIATKNELRELEKGLKNSS